MDALKELVAPMLKEEKPQFNIGDVIRIGVKIREGEKERIQAFANLNTDTDNVTDVKDIKEWEKR